MQMSVLNANINYFTADQKIQENLWSSVDEGGKFALTLIFVKPVKNTCRSEWIASLSFCLCFFMENGGRERKNKEENGVSFGLAN